MKRTEREYVLKYDSCWILHFDFLKCTTKCLIPFSNSETLYLYIVFCCERVS